MKISKHKSLKVYITKEPLPLYKSKLVEKHQNIAKLVMQHHNRVCYVVSLLNNKIEDALELRSELLEDVH
jgi:hypothetical protein